MTTYRVGIIGCGRPRQTEGATGFGMSHAHAKGYSESPHAEIVALADISEENARAFQQEWGGDEIYSDYHEMLARANLDIVSICTWPHLHADMVVAAAEAGVQAVHCEKPMAITFGDARRMVETCEANNVQLTFNHQRRFLPAFREAKRLLDEGAIGELVRVEGSCGNLYDWGTHWFDMLCMYNNETDVEWVIGQIDVRGHKTVFGALMEGHGLSHFRFKNGVEGLLITGLGAEGKLLNRIVGTDGLIEVGVSGDEPLRLFNGETGGWRAVEVEGGIHGMEAVRDGVLDLIDALKNGRRPKLAGRQALRATELIFATYESSRRRARIDLPLEIEDSPLLAMIEAGEVVLAE